MRRVAVAVVLASACADESGPLDRETIAGIARARGDALGGERSGIYQASLEVNACDCPDELGLAVCLSEDLVEAIAVFIDITEGDGFMVARFEQLPQLELSGAIDADGTATLGSVFIGFDLDSNVVLLGRFDGTFGEDGEIVGAVSLRADGKLAGAPIACGNEAEVDGIRL